MTTNAAKCTIDRNKRKMGHFSSCSLPYLQWNLDRTNLYNEVLYIMNECVQNYLGYKLYLNLPKKKITCNIYTSNLVTAHLPCVLFLSWPITRPHFSGKKFHKNSEDHEIMLKEVGVGSETSQISMDFYKGFIVLYHSSTILLVTSTSFCLFNKFRDFLNLSIKSTVFKICNNQHTQGITLYNYRKSKNHVTVLHP